MYLVRKGMFLIVLTIGVAIIQHKAIAQYGTLQGRIIDSKTLRPLPFASVYINNTTIGTTSDEDGDYLLQEIPTGTHEFIVSYIGYQIYKTKIHIIIDQHINSNVRLTQVPTNLSEVNVKSTVDKKWKRQLGTFKKIFFGTTPFTKSCTIHNPWVIEFNEDKKGTLTATTSAPLDIENLALGYRINYQLTAFSADLSNYKISGYTQFKEIETNDSLLSSLWTARRKEIYVGSSRHLFKSIIDRQTSENGFLILKDISGLPEIVRKSAYLTNINQSIMAYDLMDKVLPLSNQGQYKIIVPDRLEVHYLKKSVTPSIYRNIVNPVSWIEVKGGSIEVSSEGIPLNPSVIFFSGAMGDARMAQMLPNNYIPPTQFLIDSIETVKQNKNAFAPFFERAYLQTDRPYYYPGDALFFKAYMNYETPMLQDSLSHVLYVDLINERNEVVDKKVLHLDTDNAEGNFILPFNIAKGKYAIRAYTRWMLNFNSTNLFIKPIDILGPNELVENIEFEPSKKGQIYIVANQEEFKVREKITLAFEAKNEFDFPIAANLSVSITDINQVAPIQNEKNIITDFDFSDRELEDTSINKIKYQIQYGIDFRGKIKPVKKMIPGIVTVFQKDTDDVFTIPTAPNGTFNHHLQFSGTREFFVQGKNFKGKKVEVKMDSTLDLAVHTTFPYQHITIYEPKDLSLRHIPNSALATKMLEEVIIEGKKSERPSLSSYHHAADVSIEGDKLRQSNTTDLLSAIQMRVPGLRILYHINGGVISKFLTLGGPSSFESSQECLIIIDGIVLIPAEGQSIADQLAGMSVSEIESIDVLKFGSGAIYGVRGANGVIVVKTTNGTYEANKKSTPNFKKLMLILLSGYSESVDFSSPDYSTDNTEEQLDGRSTIYWNPNVNTDGTSLTELSFYSADLPTTYRVVIEGLTKEGKPVRGEHLIKVTR